MTTVEIPRHEWVAFFDALSRTHEDELVRIEVLRADIGAQLEVSEMPLDGFGADVKNGENVISIQAGRTRAQHVAHIISDPRRVRVLRGPSGEDQALEIIGGDDSTTLVLFGGPRAARPADHA